MFKKKALAQSRWITSNMNLIVEEGTVFGDPYYVVKDRYNLWMLESRLQWRDMVDWCKKSFGPIPLNKMNTPLPNARWYNGNNSFWFKNQKDLSMFMLKWS